MTAKKLTAQEQLWNEHALTIGRIAMSWNGLQETLAELFADLFDRTNWKLAIAAWHSLTSGVSARNAALRRKTGSLVGHYQRAAVFLEQAHR